MINAWRWTTITEDAMKRWQCSIGLLAAILAVLALDLAVIRSLTRCQPGSNQWLYLVPIDGTR
jgi:hypothetical protein